MVLLNQYDNKWKDVKMLPSSLTLGRYGCTTTSICMLSDYFNCFVLPPQVVGQNIKYTQDGLIIWESINFSKFKFTGRFKSLDPVTINDALRDPKKAVILNINHGSHWVAGVRLLPFGFYQIYDPWGGRSRIISKNEIVGFSTFQFK